MLHTVNKSPYEKNSLETCLRLATAGSDVLFIEDAVYAVVDRGLWADKVRQARSEYSLYVLGPDMEARGIDARDLIAGVQIVDFDGFVRLATQNSAVQSWL